MTPEFWRGKRVFITGHTGFKGSWLSLWLHKLGADITGLALPPATQPNMFDLARFASFTASTFADIRDLSVVQAAIAKCQPEIVFHMAAQSQVRPSYADPVATYATNMMGTVHVLEAVRQTPSVRAVINVTSDKCYSNQESHHAYREPDALGGHDPYSSSKAGAEIIGAAYRSSFFPPAKWAQHRVGLASARAGNVIGGGDWASDRLIPDLVAAFTQGKTASIRNPNAIRPWQHVLSPLYGYLLLAERLCESGEYAEAWNFGPDKTDCRSVGNVADALAARWEEKAGWSADLSQQPHEAQLLHIDSSKAKQRLGWHSVWNFEASLDALADWYGALNRGSDMNDFSLTQIQAFEQQLAPS